MSEQQGQKQQPKVLKFLNDYRKKLSLLKIKSFYANHLCKKNCLEGKLLNNNDACLKGCDDWLNNYFQLKNNKNPDQDQVVLYSSTEIPQAQRPQYQRGVANLRLGINQYLRDLEGFVDDKITKQTKK